MLLLKPTCSKAHGHAHGLFVVLICTRGSLWAMSEAYSVRVYATRTYAEANSTEDASLCDGCLVIYHAYQHSRSVNENGSVEPMQNLHKNKEKINVLRLKT